MNIKKIIRKSIQDLKPYSSARDEFTGIAEVFLDANENPINSDFNRYPDPLQRKLKARIAELKNIAPESIFLGNGSDEAIDLLIRVFCEPGGDSILVAEPTYGMYRVCAAINNVNVQGAHLNEDFDLDVASIQSLCDPSVKIIFLCSPNNPSGNLLNKEKINQLLKWFTGLIVIDEAYIDFAEDDGFLPFINRFENLIVLQTFSKAWGLAGLRLGVCYANQEIVEVLNKIKYPYNIGSATQCLVWNAIQTEKFKNDAVRKILEERKKLESVLPTLGPVRKVFPSDSNFLLVKVRNVLDTYRYLLDKKIIVRDRSYVRMCEDCLRITVGTAEENQKLINALKAL